ncbi:high-affinity nicotinic acid transporter [Phialemonium atrogriseum]|uniref:High-affinity nicotinic acid transporter n=1 Tax=Phialemonium atrogriseum TaxID=1093897 RepID=A0AAJ0BSX2_9PEZI|nr:high-affinity nicotinic acid transporter [Phialemonium atrogriseum]KAK1763705.1 high-affinity nicotinic acid transporter [Phialemonium atrogriseum]
MSLNDIKNQIDLSDQPVDGLSPPPREIVQPLNSEELKRERAVVWKLDLYIAPLIFLLQFVSNIDKGNIGFAATQGLTTDLHLKGNQLNGAVSVFYVLYICVEIPAALMVKRLGFHRFVPCIVGIWGLVCMCTGFVQSYGGLMATRLMLGAAEGCLFPSLSIFLLNWYRREEMGVRIFLLFGAPAVAGAFGGLLAFAILHMDGVAGYPGWRWLYIIEGLITLVVAFACVFIIPKSFETAYFLNADDKRIMRRRAELAEAYSGGSGHYKWADVKLALADPKVFVSGVAQHATITILYGFGTFLPVIIKSGLGYSTVQAQYLTIPVFVWGTIVYFSVALLSDKLSTRFIPMMALAPFMVAGYAVLLAPVSSGVHYFATFLVATGVYICAGINFSWLSSNSAPDGKRAASVGIQQSMAQVAGVVSGQIYQSTRAPGYTLGHAYSLGCVGVAMVGWCVMRWILGRREERKKEAGNNREGWAGVWDDRAPDFKYLM